MDRRLSILLVLLALSTAVWSQQRFVLGRGGLSWQSGGGFTDPTVLFKPRGSSVREDTTNAPGDAIDFDHYPGWISPLFFDPDENIADRVLERDGRAFLINAFYGATEADQLRGMVNGDHSVAFERRPSLTETNPKIRDVWIGLDFAVPVGVHRVRFYPRNTVAESPFFAFQDDYLRAYELWINPHETDLDTPDILVRRNMANEQPVVDIALSPQYIRQLKLRSLTAVPFEVDELEVYGTGYMRNATYLSDIIDLGDRASIGPLHWIESVIGDSLFSQLSVRLRTGHDDTPLIYQQWLRDSQGRITGPTNVSPRQYYALERRDRVPLGPEDDDNWSPWFSVERGQLSAAPQPRRYAQLEIQFSGGLFDARRMGQIEFEYLVPPIADGLWAEVYPRLAEAEQPASFRYGVRLKNGGNARGFDRIEVDTNVAVTDIRELKIDGQPAEFDIEYVREDGFALRFPLINSDGAVLEFTFDLPIFRFGTTFSGRAYNAQFSSVPQQLQPGDAVDFGPDDFGPLSGLFVAIPKKQLGKLVGEIDVSHRIFTPNGDGINERFGVSFNLLQLVQPAPVTLDLFSLSGQRIHRICRRELGIGPSECGWDGRLKSGVLVQPGTYVWVLTVGADAFDERHMGVVSLAY